jgi:hypothetical protein
VVILARILPEEEIDKKWAAIDGINDRARWLSA